MKRRIDQEEPPVLRLVAFGLIMAVIVYVVMESLVR
jgi:hypothetical protein